MDFEYDRTKSASIARDIELPLDLTGGGARFVPTSDRYARVLRLARERNPANVLPDKLCRVGMGLFMTLAAADLAVWGALFANATLLLASWAVISLLIILPVLLTAYIRQALGLASKLHKFHSPALILAPDRVILEMKRHMLFRGKHSPTVRREFLYDRVDRLEYDRSSKTLRLSSAGAQAPSLEVVMFYENSDAIIREIEERSGVFVHPAMRGDDYADLRDLPGLRRERSLLRPMSVGALVFCLASLLTVLAIRSHNQNNPYLPYPRTQEAFLVGRFGVGDTVTLDGCDITLNGVTRAGSDARGVCYQFLVTVRNGNASPIRMRSGEAYKDSPGNILFTAVTEGSKTVPLETSGPPPGYVGVNLPCPSRLPSGKNVGLTFFIWVPDGAERVEMTVNSDYWPPADILRDVTYTGGITEIGNRPVKNNEVCFSLSRPALDH
ncbi:MAG: hypothetical protein LBH95_09185 [Oscillospiraceae bacterium]|jgi:hypothetical protein|nr:hypothetical protein [Oscillospiraceae bacterium]